MTSAVRTPAVAGRFYPDHADRLLREIDGYTSPPQTRISAIGCVAPHAGYMYSGHVAGAVYARLEIPEHCIILCPNHTGRGVPLSIMTATAWQTPLGEVAPGTELAPNCCGDFPSSKRTAPLIAANMASRCSCHFLQAQQKNLHIVPIAVGTSDFGVLRELGEAIAEVIGEREEADQKILIIASSDMNHYEDDAITRVKDQQGHRARARA